MPIKTKPYAVPHASSPNPFCPLPLLPMRPLQAPVAPAPFYSPGSASASFVAGPPSPTGGDGLQSGPPYNSDANNASNPSLVSFADVTLGGVNGINLAFSTTAPNTAAAAPTSGTQQQRSQPQPQPQPGAGWSRSVAAAAALAGEIPMFTRASSGGQPRAVGGGGSAAGDAPRVLAGVAVRPPHGTAAAVDGSGPLLLPVPAGPPSSSSSVTFSTLPQPGGQGSGAPGSTRTPHHQAPTASSHVGAGMSRPPAAAAPAGSGGVGALGPPLVVAAALGPSGSTTSTTGSSAVHKSSSSGARQPMDDTARLHALTGAGGEVPGRGGIKGLRQRISASLQKLKLGGTREHHP